MAVRIGCVGTGLISVRHLVHLQQIGAAEVVALCDVELQRCRDTVSRVNAELHLRGGSSEKQQRTLEARCFTDVREMLSETELDAVYIMVPPFAHGEIEMVAIEAGLHLFVEKPVALSLEVAREIDAAIREKGLISCVGYQWRYANAIDKAKASLSGLDIGMVMGVFFVGMPATPWWRIQERSGGQLVEQATHTLDLMRYMAGNIESVCATAALRGMGDIPEFDIFDVSVATLRFSSGAIGSISNTCMLPHAPRLGAPWVHGVHVIARDLWVSASSQRGVRISNSEGVQEIPITNDYMYDLDLAFVQAVEESDPAPIRSSYSDSLKTLAVTLAVEESARTGKIVHLE